MGNRREEELVALGQGAVWRVGNNARPATITSLQRPRAAGPSGKAACCWHTNGRDEQRLAAPHSQPVQLFSAFSQWVSSSGHALPRARLIWPHTVTGRSSFSLIFSSAAAFGALTLAIGCTLANWC